MVNVAPSDSALPACPLPEAVYRAPELTREHLYDVTNKDYGVADGFGQTNTLAKVNNFAPVILAEFRKNKCFTWLNK